MHGQNEAGLVAPRKLVKIEFQELLDSANITGSILIYDAEKDQYYANDFSWASRGNLPASTFKIPNSIIALETGVVKNEDTLFKWDGRKRALKAWEQDLTLRDAFHESCVPCYQDVARRIGLRSMKEYVGLFKYGAMRFDSNDLDSFWLVGDSRINQFQQIGFLRRFNASQLPISIRTQVIMDKMMIIDQHDDYTLSGKTGWTNSEGIDNGWYVGYVEKGKKVYFFATNVEPKEGFNMDFFPSIRKEVTHRALQSLNVMP